MGETISIIPLIKKEEIKTEVNKNPNDDNKYKDFNIKLRNPILKINIHTSYIHCLTILNDGRLVSGSYDQSIIIYNKITIRPDLTIKEQDSPILCITTLSSGILATGSNNIKLYNIKRDNYELLQTISYHIHSVTKIVELNNKNLISCSSDHSVIFYFKDKSEYKKDYKVPTNGGSYAVIQTKDNEICYFCYDICFFDLLERKIKSTIRNINHLRSSRLSLIMLNKDLLLIPGENKMSIINVNNYRLVRVIDVQGSGFIVGATMLNETILLTSDYSKDIRQWRIEGDNLIPTYKRENAHDGMINVLLSLGNGYFASGSYDKSIKIWWQKKFWNYINY